MKTVSMLEFRQNALAIVQGVQGGQRVMLTYRGRPVAILEPPDVAPQHGDPFYALADLADGNGRNQTNQEIDEAIYGG